MIYLLISKLIMINPKFSGLNAFSYLSSRAILALITSIVVSMLLYPRAIRLLRSLKAGQPIRELGLEEQMLKKGTPTMGGVVIIFATLLSAILWMDVTNRHFVTLVIVTIGFGFVGFLDDYLKISKKNTAGLSSKKKMLGLLLFGFLAVIWHLWSANELIITHASSQSPTTVNIPFLKNVVINLGYLYAPFAILVIVGSSNAVNLTDGLDGLAIGPVITCALTLTILSYVTGNTVVSKYLYYHSISGTGEISVFLSGVIGASIGFLWYNTFPAQIFMGDSGALSLGGILGTVAVITGHEILLVLMGGIFVAEALSVIIQVVSFKTRGKRVFRMAPVHHHYQKKGWPEQKITVRIWIISFILALLSILTLKLR
ncbi:phospho-N-acetylmuramoyl-pentapeptide-transferase [Spirobacillus cienkowskii]|jgi:phospho-N-acetylmuramoyl-pentapeptide-transferase|uniref:Phospho-N-acetylmuramoyl-pentapeptide-transferase n=1 Tax=Spirobacillus cienkowskii TaxID=495820 RepID=A0A369KX66_9BACT|nr:MAG: phospho-N-acetylmuramoyl-pentapeptide-transferase [Spirobacillus cienkowskii]